MAGATPGLRAEAGGGGHVGWVRLCHWLIALSVLILGGSGVVILMAHPRLYWGDAGNDLMRAWLELPLGRNYHHGGWAAPLAFFGEAGPISRVRTYDIFNQNGWARSLHFLSAWVFVTALGVYLAAGLFSGHLRRAILPRAADLAPATLWRDVQAHLRLPAPAALGGPPYGVLQKLAYFGVGLVALPVMVLTGLAMSPAVDAAWPILPVLFGGPQSARSIHFLILCALAVFLLVHLAMVVISGFRRQMRAMTLGG
jgi:thiosulfate reductase cytochrome b subunit